MEESRTIMYNGQAFPFREAMVDLNEGEGPIPCRIGCDELVSQLVDNDGKYVSDEARDIDEQIFCYVPASVLAGETEKLLEYINTNIG